jgi:hypothetical protein
MDMGHQRFGNHPMTKSRVVLVETEASGASDDARGTKH